MSAANIGFRAQLAIPEQRHLYDYWLTKCREDRLPSRQDVKPGDFRLLLPWISLIDCETAAGPYRIRLAGTQLREIYGREATGKLVTECEAPPHGAAYWSVMLARVGQGRPAQGIVPVHRPGTEFMTRFWLRLPLQDAAGAVTIVLGYDVLVFAAKLGALGRAAKAAQIA